MSDESQDIKAVAKDASSSIKSFISGGVGGVAAVLVGQSSFHSSSCERPGHTSRSHPRLSFHTGHPFDLTKTRLQTAPEGTYRGGLDVVKQTLARDGVKGCANASPPFPRNRLANLYIRPLVSMYRGMGPPIVGVTPIFAISFWVRWKLAIGNIDVYLAGLAL